MLLSLATWGASALAAPNINQYLCPAQCNGTNPKSPFNFKQKAGNFGDPNGGGNLGSSFLTPKTEDNSPDDSLTPSESAPTGTALDQLNTFENWSAQTCGTSLNDAGDVQVAVPCPQVNSLYNRWKLNVINKHKPTSPYHPPASPKGMDQFFNAANSPEAKEKLKTYLWIRDDGIRTHFQNCKSEGIDPTNKDLFAVEINGSMCSYLEAPKLNGSQVYPGLPPGTFTKADIGGKASVYVFGKEFEIIGGIMSLYSPAVGDVSRTTQFSYLGNLKVNDNNIQQPSVKYDKPLVLDHIHEGTAATFTIGPVPITVEGGVDGTAQVNMIARGTNVWANARIVPGVFVDGYARAYVNLFVIKAGVEAAIVLLHNTLDIYAFSGLVATQVTVAGNTGNSFIFSQQLALINDINALQGKIGAFVKVAVPKFIGWKWKKYNTTIFDWGGVSAKGYLYNDAIDGMWIKNVKNTTP